MSGFNEEPAKILSHVHDQGGGTSWCSACDGKVQLSDTRCPTCKRPLVLGECTFNTGGSDF